MQDSPSKAPRERPITIGTLLILMCVAALGFALYHKGYNPVPVVVMLLLILLARETASEVALFVITIGIILAMVWMLLPEIHK